MSFSFKIDDNSAAMISAIEKAVRAGMEEAGGEFVAQAARNSRVDTGDTKASFDYVVDGDTLYVGSNAENAIWEEFGTGAYAESGGSSGYWVFVKGAGGSSKRSGKRYSLEEAKQIMAILRSRGLEAYYTNGKRGTRALTKAMQEKQAVAEKLIARKLGGI